MNHPRSKPLWPLLVALVAAALMISTAHGQTSVVLNWAHTQPGVTFNLYRAGFDCATVVDANFVKLNTAAITAKTFTDSNVAPGRYCYRVTALAAGLESLPSNRAAADVPPIPPTDLSLSLKIAVLVAPDGTVTAKLLEPPKGCRPEWISCETAFPKER